MGKKKRHWQDVQGRREDQIGGGLIRSLGGWSEAIKLRMKEQDHIKSDERILGDSDFVDSVLAQADDHYTRQSELRRRGYSLREIVKKAAEIYGMDEQEVLARGRQQQRVKGRSLFCYWAVHELGVALTDLARKLRMRTAGVGYAVQRRAAIANENGYQLL